MTIMYTGGGRLPQSRGPGSCLDDYIILCAAVCGVSCHRQHMILLLYMTRRYRL